MSSIDDNVVVELDNIQKELLITNLDEEGIKTLNSLKKIIVDAQKKDSEWSSMIKCAVDKEFIFY
mgnify:CR=1 FL=1